MTGRSPYDGQEFTADIPVALKHEDVVPGASGTSMLHSNHQEVDEFHMAQMLS